MHIIQKAHVCDGARNTRDDLSVLGLDRYAESTNGLFIFDTFGVIPVHINVTICRQSCS